MIIREATLADLSTLVSFQMRMAKETENIELDEKLLTQGITELLNHPEHGKYYVAVEGNIALGCLMTTYEWSDWRCGTVLWIQSVYIDSAHRSKGVYSTMYQYFQEKVKQDPSLRGIRLYVDKTNKKAQRTYERLGMNGEHYATYEWMKPIS
jgi:ribosomal protein S18 acetylase RimI-like enzyme